MDGFKMEWGLHGDNSIRTEATLLDDGTIDATTYYGSDFYTWRATPLGIEDQRRTVPAFQAFDALPDEAFQEILTPESFSGQARVPFCYRPPVCPDRPMRSIFDLLPR